MRPEFVIERQGKIAVLYAGLLDEAHAKGLRRIHTDLIQFPTDNNGHVAICKAEVETDQGTFTGYGDASPQNVAKAMQNCLIRMAETRAKARALRDAINIGSISVEELPGAEGHSVRTPQSTQNTQTAPGQITSSQKSMLAELTKRHGLQNIQLDGLSFDDASKLIAELRQRPVEKTTAPSQNPAVPAPTAVQPPTRPAPQPEPEPTFADPFPETKMTHAGSVATAIAPRPAVIAPPKPSTLPSAPPMTEGQRRTIEAMSKQLGIATDCSRLTLADAQHTIGELRRKIEAEAKDVQKAPDPDPSELAARGRALTCLRVIGFSETEIEAISTKEVTGSTPSQRIAQWNVIHDMADQGQIEPAIVTSDA